MSNLEIPKRFSNQAALEAFASTLDDDQFVALYHVLRSRKWTDAEITDRVQPLRPKIDLLNLNK